VKNPKAYALLDTQTGRIRMHYGSKALAIFDTRAAARAARCEHTFTKVMPIVIKRAGK
jgi:hypothetical protein